MDDNHRRRFSNSPPLSVSVKAGQASTLDKNTTHLLPDPSSSVGDGGTGGGGGGGGLAKSKDSSLSLSSMYNDGQSGANGDSPNSKSTNMNGTLPNFHNSETNNHSFHRVALSVLFFCGSSLGAIFVNKACLTHFKFDFPSTLMVLQVALTILLLSVLSRVRPSLVPIVSIKSSDLRRLVPSTLCFIANVTVGLSALSRVNIPMFSAFRRLTVLFVMGAEFFMLGKTHSRAVVFSVLVLTSGAFVSALGDVTFTVTGYMLVFLNNLLTAAYLASIKRVMHDLDLDPTSLLYYTSWLAFQVVLAIAVATQDLKAAYWFYTTNEALRSSKLFPVALFTVAASAFCVNLSTSICTHVTSPLTTAVAGQVKNVLQSVLGFFSWGYVPTPLNVVGLLVALGGQLAFATFKYRDSKRSGNSALSQGKSGTASAEEKTKASEARTSGGARRDERLNSSSS